MFTSKTTRQRMVGIILLGSCPAISFAAAGTGQSIGRAMNSIADSYHNLGATNIRPTNPNGGTPANHSNDTAEICVFCHTPHGGDNSAAVPIWNRVLSDPQLYTRYASLGTATFDATEAPIGSVTIACLSCHDGTQSINVVLNAPGSGRFSPDGVLIGNNFLGDDFCVQSRLCDGLVQNLGTDLSNDHPVSMQYAGGGISAANPDGPSDDPDFLAGANLKPHPDGFTLNFMAAPSTSVIQTLWWIERGADSINNGARDRADVILYTRHEVETGVAGGEQPFVECGSCHDPHNVDNPTFLRVSNGIPDALTGDFPNANGGPSALCLTCHLK